MITLVRFYSSILPFFFYSNIRSYRRAISDSISFFVTIIVLIFILPLVKPYLSTKASENASGFTRANQVRSNAEC